MNHHPYENHIPLTISSSASTNTMETNLERIISPSVLDNFDLYVVLKPKILATPPIEINDPPLIDFSVDDDILNVSGEKQLITEPKESIIRKESCKLADLVDNVLVTALDVEENKSRIDFTDFFNQCENNKKFIASNNDCPRKSNNEVLGNDYNNQAKNYNETARIVDDLFDNYVMSEYPTREWIGDVSDTHNKNNNNLIDTVLYNKMIETERTIKLKTNVQKSKDTEKGNTDETNKLNRKTTTVADMRPTKTNIQLHSVFSDIKSQRGIYINNPLKYYDPVKFLYAIKDVDVDNYELRILPMTLNRKLYAKKRITISDDDKMKFMKGPSLKEKRIVLPQIMRRLIVKKSEMDKEQNCNKRYVLDAGNGKLEGDDKKSVGELNLQVLTSDCNKDRLKALRRNQNFEAFVLGGNNLLK